VAHARFLTFLVKFQQRWILQSEHRQTRHQRIYQGNFNLARAMIRKLLKTAPKGLQESRGRKMLPERSEHGCFSKDSENPLSTYQKVCENNSSPLNYNYLNNKIIYRKPGIAVIHICP
jgi:hypothetical protein